MVKASLIAIVGLIFATALAIGFGLLVPVNSVVGDFFDVFAVGRPSSLLGCSTASSVSKIINRPLVFEPEGPQARGVVLD